VALLDVLVRMGAVQGFTVVAGHLDHGIRPESAADAAFCEQLCARLGVRLRLGRADVPARARRDHLGLEDAARTERHAFLRTVAAGEGAALVALAHTRDDQAETLLLRLLRGSGTAGLASMRLLSGDLLRPLLAASRAEVLAHLAAHGLDWREDASNADRTLLRNRVRHELLPYLEERFNPAIRAALARTATLLAAEADALHGAASDLRATAVRAHDGGVVVDRRRIAAAPDGLARSVLRSAIGEAGGLRGVALVHVDRTLALARREGAGEIALPGRRRARVRAGQVWIETRETTTR
jgi:tRNA(Ile)-lysidine synthase